MLKSIATQTGNFSYSLNLNFTGYGPFEFGFSGDSKIFSFSGQSGKIFDQDSNYFYSYDVEEGLNISGNKIDNYNNYYVEGVLFNSSSSQNTGYSKFFYLNGVSGEFSFDGVLPSYEIDSGVFLNGSSSGNIEVSNNSADTEFRIYSININSLETRNFTFQSGFHSGDIASNFTYPLFTSEGFGFTGKFPVVSEIKTNFGTISKNIDIYSIFTLTDDFVLNGPSFFPSTGFYDYTLDYNLSLGLNKYTTPYSLQLEFKNNSGVGDVLNYIEFTGYPASGSISLEVSRNITESGSLTGGFTTFPTGYNTGLQYDTSGISTGNLSTGIQWATGDFYYSVSFPATGQVSGNIDGRLNVTGNYNGLENTGIITYTGQNSGYLDTITGLTLSGYWGVDGRLVNFTSPQTLTSEPISVPLAAQDTNVYYNYSFPTTGLASGHLKDTVVAYRSYIQTIPSFFGFTGNVYSENSPITGIAVFTGLTGIVTVGGETIALGNGIYTGIASGITGITLEKTTVENVESIYTGSSTGVAEFDFIAQTENISGNVEGSFDVLSMGRYEYTAQKTPLSGNYYSKIFVSTSNYDSYIVNFQDSQSTTGFAYFTGDYEFEGTGFCVGDCTGLSYTGAGIIGVTGKNLITILPSNTGFFRDPSIAGEFNFCIPLSGSRWFDNPLEISGNSGIALCANYTDRIAYTEDFSANDSPRGNDTKSPFVLNYKWMDGATIFNDDVSFIFSPYYYASGTGIYQSTDNLSSSITFYSGDFPTLDYKEVEIFSFDSEGWNGHFNDTPENPATFNQNTGDWKILITIDDGENVPPSGFFYVAWYDDSNNTQNNPIKTFNSYLGEDYEGQMVLTSSFTGFVPSIESGRPTGTMNYITVQNRDVNFIERGGPELLSLSLTGTGLTSSVEISGERSVYLTGEFDGYNRSGNYFSEITGYQLASLDTGTLNGTSFYYNYISGITIGSNLFTQTAKNMFSGLVGSSYTVEQFSGDLANKITGLGFNIFLNEPTLNISGDPITSTAFGLSLSKTTLGSSYNTFSNNFNTINQQQVITTGSGYKTLSHPTPISGTSISGFFSGQVFNFSLTSSWTGSFRATGILSGERMVVVPEGFNSTGDSIASGDLFYGNTGTINIPSRVFYEELNGWIPLTGEIFTGNYNKTVYNTGELPSTGFYSGTVISGNTIVPFTGQITGTANITGLQFSILPTSGSFLFSGITTGNESTINGLNFGFFDDINDAVKVEEFSGVYNSRELGTGIYTSGASYHFQDISFAYYAPSYIKTFTGEYEFFTGINSGNLIQIPYNSNITGYTSGITITGEDQVFLRVHKKRHFSNYPDQTQIFYSGETPTTGGLTIG